MTKKTSEIDFKKLGMSLLNELLKIVQDTKNFAIKQIPDVIAQLIKFKIFEHVLRLIFRLAFILAIGCASGWAFYLSIQSKEILFLVGSAMIGIFATVWIFAIGADVVRHVVKIGMILLAPKIYLIEFLTDWAKKMNGGSEH